MPEEKEVRKLAAIMHADVKGYSRLMGEDESYTVHALKECRQLFADNIRNHGGRVVNAPGDSILAEFTSVVSAVQCAAEIQNQLNTRNADLPENRRMLFRIGVNLGDVIQSEDAIYGDGVNIAARIEALAEAGGVSISRTVFNHVSTKLKYGYAYQGEHRVKNIVKPVKVYKLLTAAEDAGKLIGEEPKVLSSKWIWPTTVVAAIVVALIGYHIYHKMTESEFEPASVEKMNYPLPEKPSIAVLPFENMSGDPEQEYFSDGMTDDLITDLSKISGLFVISRNSTFTYKGKPIKIREVAEQLGVRYVLEGSVRRQENKVRINAQLIDATTGWHVWAERYDGKMSDIFVLQDNITMSIVEAVSVTLTIDEKRELPQRETESLEAYLNFLKGWQYYRKFNPEAISKSIPLLEKAIDIEPHYGRAYAMLARIYLEVSERGRWIDVLGIPQRAAFNIVWGYLDKAMENPTALAFAVSAEMHWRSANFEEAINKAEAAVNLDPNDPESHIAKGLASMFTGSPMVAAESFRSAMRLDPFHKGTFGYFLGWANFHMKNYNEAVKLCKLSLDKNPENPGPLWCLTASYALLGQMREAKDALVKLKIAYPMGASMSYLPYNFKYKHSEDYNLLADALKKAGMK